ncbi:hypothetical protein N7517_007639 [Penicillium concentricum]|uniref:N-acetyltransferase domain-containing protein n=1 Tax=Penicillium concentricum TaxID=293559 RepID=A0A9W9SBL0_9EURO|nr:uncharacterized protein N7517_007639 [Penicillium concentricum]KAJ5375633.1 hypothetical protein N7517_007639 [Penicillium concentricum]
MTALWTWRSDSPSVQSITTAFSSDPLIKWLRPNAKPWDYQDALTQRWQHRRIKSVMSEGIVLQSASVGQIAEEYPRKNKKAEPSDGAAAPRKTAHVSVPENPVIATNQGEAGAVVFLYPPKEHRPWSISSMWYSWKMWLLELFNPVKDTLFKDERVKMLMSRHTPGKRHLQARYSKLWYLEVIAVHPSLQSRGLGGSVMRAILEKVGGNPIFLECTRQENISFYEVFGFKLIEEVDLTDTPAHIEEDGKLKYWVMVHETDSTQ